MHGGDGFGYGNWFMDQSLTIALANSGRKWIGEIAHVAMLYDQLERLGHRPWIVCRQGYALHQHAVQAGWRTLDLEFNSGFHPWTDGRDLTRWLQWARRENPDIIHCHRGKDHWLGLAVAQLLGRPLVRTRHVVVPVVRHWMNRWLYLHATHAILCVSKATRESFGVWQDRLPAGRVILSAVDSDRFHPQGRSDAWRRLHAAAPWSDPADGAGEQPLWFGLIGRFQSIKGQQIYLEAAGRVAAQVPQAHFLIAGAGSDNQRLRYEARAEELGFGKRLVVLGFRPDLPEILASLDVGVIASLGSEGSSRIALEMMASGLPLVATRVGGIPDITEPRGVARLVAPGDPAAMAEAMLAWAKDPEARRATGLAARQHVLQAHHPRLWAETIVKAYQDAIHRKYR